MSNITVITLNKFGKRARGCCIHAFLVIECMGMGEEIWVDRGGFLKLAIAGHEGHVMALVI